MSEAGNPWWGSTFPVELLTPVEMAEADRLAGETMPSRELMEAAGDAVAQVALRLGDPSSARILVLCGPGNNGGDGYVAACRLAAAGCQVMVAALGSRADLRGDAAEAAACWTGEVIPLADAPVESSDLVIDALFGAGLSRAITGDAATAINRLNARRKQGTLVLAVDIPSGVDGASGAVRGVAVEATHTVTFFRLKPGHVLLPGRQCCGRVELAQIGIDGEVLETIAPRTWLNGPALWGSQFPVPSLEGHKYTRGHALIVSGPIAQTGAARLCARGALRAGAGLVTVASPAEALAVHATALTAIMTRVSDGPDGLLGLLQDARKNVVALGPGLGVGASSRALVQAALKRARPDAPPRGIVLDADALTSFADDPPALFAMIAAAGHTVVMTPHDGEFGKLFRDLSDLAEDKPARARAAAAASGALVVLKGPDTVVAHPEGRVAIAASEAPWLATAGSGDVLAGMIAGLLAQRMPPFEACAAAVWLHAEAARRFGIGLVSEDIPEALPSLLASLLRQGAIREN